MAPRRRNEVVSSIVMYAGVLPAAIYWARRENDRAPWIAAAAVCAAVVRHRTTILDAFTLKIPAVLRLLVTYRNVHS